MSNYNILIHSVHNKNLKSVDYINKLYELKIENVDLYNFNAYLYLKNNKNLSIDDLKKYRKKIIENFDSAIDSYCGNPVNNGKESCKCHNISTMFLEEYREGMKHVDNLNKQNDENYKNQYKIYEKKLEQINKDAEVYRKQLADERKTTNCDSWNSVTAYCNNGKHGEFTEVASTESCCFLGFFGYCAPDANDGKKEICKRPESTITAAVNSRKIEKQQTLKVPKKPDVIPYGQFNPNINCCTNIIQNIADGSKLDQIQQKCDQVIQNIINQEQRKEGDSTVKSDVVLKVDQENDSKGDEGGTEVNKTSNTIVILIVVFVVLLLLGVIGGGLFYYYKNNNSGEDSNTEASNTEDLFIDE
jgi:hypothetical protein